MNSWLGIVDIPHGARNPGSGQAGAPQAMASISPAPPPVSGLDRIDFQIGRFDVGRIRFFRAIILDPELFQIGLQCRAADPVQLFEGARERSVILCLLYTSDAADE